MCTVQQLPGWGRTTFPPTTVSNRVCRLPATTLVMHVCAWLRGVSFLPWNLPVSFSVCSSLYIPIWQPFWTLKRKVTNRYYSLTFSVTLNLVVPEPTQQFPTESATDICAKGYIRSWGATFYIPLVMVERLCKIKLNLILKHASYLPWGQWCISCSNSHVCAL